MGYLHIENLYRTQHILAFRECYALEKVHGTSAHIAWSDGALRFFSGGESHERFVGLFDGADLATRFTTLGHPSVTVFGEAYGGKQQGMRATYGEALHFIAFDVQVGETWLAVPDAAEVVAALGLEFVPYAKGAADLAWLDAQRDAPSVVAVRRGCGEKAREGVVLRPLFEVTLNNGARVIAKHKRDEFRERTTPQKVVDPAALAVLAKADAIAAEWVTEMRLSHVLQRIPTPHRMEQVPQIITAMIEDVTREAAGEIVDSKEARRAIGKRAAEMFKARVARID